MTSVGDTFSVNITVEDVNDLGGWEFKLYYLSSILNGTNLREGPFLKQGGSTYFSTISFTDNYNSTHGIAWATCTLLGPTGVNGNGTLAIITFKAQHLGTSILSLTDTLLSDSQPIPHVALNGVVHVLPHDVAVTDLTLSKTIVGQGLTTKMYVNVSNQGNFTETFNVTLNANTTAISTQTITLTSGSSTNIAILWNTTDFVKGNYIISAYAWTVDGESDLLDNMFTDGWALVRTPGDINGDRSVNYLDAILLGAAFGSQPGDPDWYPNADINGDNITSYLDGIILGAHFGQMNS
jgi:hypothetical protein